MHIAEIAKILKADVLCGENIDEVEIISACGSDLMSDVLAYTKDQSMLLTGLLNPQSIRTAEMLDMRCVVFVRGKVPNDDVVALAKERGIAVLCTKYRMFAACGRLYAAGLGGGCEAD